MAVEVAAGPNFMASMPRQLFSGDYYVNPLGNRSYAVAPDGRFIMMKGRERAELRIILNWIHEVRPR